MLKISTLKICRMAALFLVLSVLSACGGGDSKNTAAIQNDEQTQAITVRFEAPALFKSSPDVDEKQLTPLVSIDGLIIGGFQKATDGFWSRVKTEVALNNAVNFKVVWSIKYSQKTLILGRVETSEQIDSNTTIVTVDQSILVTDYDEDEDGVSNFDELAQNIDPFTFDENLVASSLKVKFTIPDVDYAGKPDVGAVWNGRQIALTNNGSAYEGIERSLTPSEGRFRISVHSLENGIRTHVYQYETASLTVKEGENYLEVSADEFVAKPLNLKVTAKIPDRNYRGDFSVTLFDLSKNTNSDLTLNGGSYAKSLEDVAPGQKLMAIEIRSKSSDVLWARAEKNHTVKVGANNTAFIQSDFNFSIDSDGDGTNNIDDAEPKIANIDVNIPFAANGPPVVDGLFDEAAWSAAAAIDSSGQALHINHLIMDRRVSTDVSDSDDIYEQDLQPSHAWRAMYDESYLYILVEVSKDKYPTCDSKDPWDDDNLNIYWDGDNSKGTTYDGLNDFHLMIPLFQFGDVCNAFNTNGRMRNGINSATMTQDDGLRYASGQGADKDHYIYEVRINLENAGIASNRIFGFDIHIDDDDNGAGRDQKWAWKHPSRGATDVDETYKNPSVMANIILN